MQSGAWRSRAHRLTTKFISRGPRHLSLAPQSDSDLRKVLLARHDVQEAAFRAFVEGRLLAATAAELVRASLFLSRVSSAIDFSSASPPAASSISSPDAVSAQQNLHSASRRSTRLLG